MKLKVNGEDRSFDRVDTLSDLLKMLDIRAERIASEVNMEIIPKANYDSFRLKEGDVVEILQFVGGGAIFLS